MKVFLFLFLAMMNLGAEQEKAKPTVIERAEFAVGSTKYTGVKLALVKPNEVVIRHDSGISRIHPSKLAPDLAEELGYDKAAAAVADFPLSLQCLGAKEENGKYRWFFNVTNKGAKPFLGSFKITMLNLTEPIESGWEVFVSKGKPGIAPGAWTRVSLISHNAPESVHGDYGIGGFRCDLTDGEGDPIGGSITQKITGKMLVK